MPGPMKTRKSTAQNLIHENAKELVEQLNNINSKLDDFSKDIDEIKKETKDISSLKEEIALLKEEIEDIKFDKDTILAYKKVGVRGVLPEKSTYVQDSAAMLSTRDSWRRERLFKK